MTSLPFECDACEEPRYSDQMISCVRCKSLVGFCHGGKHGFRGKIVVGSYELTAGYCSKCARDLEGSAPSEEEEATTEPLARYDGNTRYFTLGYYAKREDGGFGFSSIRVTKLDGTFPCERKLVEEIKGSMRWGKNAEVLILSVFEFASKEDYDAYLA